MKECSRSFSCWVANALVHAMLVFSSEHSFDSQEFSFLFTPPSSNFHLPLAFISVSFLHLFLIAKPFNMFSQCHEWHKK